MSKPEVTRSAFCNVKDCGMPAAWYPEVRIWAQGHSKANSHPMALEIGMSFCHEHKGEFKVEDLGPELEKLTRSVCRAGRLVQPDMSSAEVVMLPFGGDGG